MDGVVDEFMEWLGLGMELCLRLLAYYAVLRTSLLRSLDHNSIYQCNKLNESFAATAGDVLICRPVVIRYEIEAFHLMVHVLHHAASLTRWETYSLIDGRWM